MAAAETATHAAEAAYHGGFDLIPIVVLLGAAVIAVPLFKRLGLGSVLGYLAAGLIIGPLFVVAELGFLLGLRPELKLAIEQNAGPVGVR